MNAKYLYNPGMVNITVSTNLDAGDVIQLYPNFYAIAPCEATSGTVAALQTEGTIQLTAGANVSAGAAVYYTSNGICNVTSSAGTCIGHALEAVTSGGIVKVLLNR